ncbi:glycosyltransferase [Roseibium litorale]|uniref:Glycosyltransferase n=1 Tax=Roseibium litorale TaxID=2803841 RepID=A0ABR9CVJ0_9HYPH|nr:glycosyltransferase [Roseibium litorale]MBD8894265.1 glycosyltransferase [Roseibium litorale]
MMRRFFASLPARCFARKAFVLAHLGRCAAPVRPAMPVLSVICEAGADIPNADGVERIAAGSCWQDDAAKAAGHFVGFLPARDRLSPRALEVLVAALSGPAADAGLLYGDALLTGPDGQILKPVLKPAFDPALFREIDYISPFAVFRRDRLLSVARSLPSPALALWPGVEVVESVLEGLAEKDILHLPYPLVRTAVAPQRRLETRNGAADRTSWPQVTVVIPSRNGFELTSQVLRGLLEETDYPDLKVFIQDNGSDDARVLALYEDTRRRFPNFSYEIIEEPFNFSRSVNRGLAKVGSGHVLLLNNDVEVTDPGWLKEMVSCLDLPKAGIVGAKLLYPDGRLQHAGVIAGMGGLASHWYYKCSPDIPGHFGRLNARNSMTCVTGAVMLISDQCLARLGPWDEENFAVAYNDVDYCLRAYEAGIRTVWTPHAVLYHHESVTRGKDRSRKRKAQFASEKKALQSLHGMKTFEDPAFSPWLSKRPGGFRFRWRRSLPAVRTWWAQSR